MLQDMAPCAVHELADRAGYRADCDLGVELVVAERADRGRKGRRPRAQEPERCVAVWGLTPSSVRGVALFRGALLQRLRIATRRGDDPPMPDGVPERDVMRDRSDRPTVFSGGRVPLCDAQTLDQGQKCCRCVREASRPQINLDGRHWIWTITGLELRGYRRAPMRRVSVFGNVGTGKTTFARALAARLNVPYIELDALHWGPGWTPATAEVMRDRVREAIAGDAWVVDGSYLRKIGGLVWTRADTLVWLDPPWIPTFVRILRRTIHRSLTRVELFGGNRESLREAFFSRDSILLFAIRAGLDRGRGAERLLAQPEYAHLTVHRFRSHAEADRWLLQADRSLSR